MPIPAGLPTEPAVRVLTVRGPRALWGIVMQRIWGVVAGWSQGLGSEAGVLALTGWGTGNSHGILVGVCPFV